MSELTDKLRGACIDWDGTEEKDLAEPVHFVSCGDLRAAADALEAQEARIKTMEKGLNDIRALLPNPTLPITHAIRDIANLALTPSLPK